MFTELNDLLGVPFKFRQLDALSRNFCNLLTPRYSSFDFGFTDRRKFLFQFDEPTPNLIRSRNGFFFNSTCFFTVGSGGRKTFLITADWLLTFVALG